MFCTIRLVTALILLSGVCAAFAQPGNTTTIALSGDAVPGGGGGETYSGFPQFFPVFDSNGTLTYHANTSTGDSVLISNNEVAIRTGEQVPGATPGTVVSFFEAAPFAGGVYLSALYTGPDVDLTNDSGILLRQNGVTTSEVRSGDSAPGTTDLFGIQVGLRTTNAGDLVFSTQLQNSGGFAIYVKPAGSTLDLLDREGAPIPVTEFLNGEGAGDGGGTITKVSTTTSNNSRRIALYLRKWPGLNPQTEHNEIAARIIPATAGDIQPVLQTGDGGFNLPVGTTIEEMFVPQVNDADQLLASIKFAGASSGRSLHQFQLDNDTVTSGRSIILTGGALPGPFQLVLGNVLTSLQNKNGHVAFVADAEPTLPPLIENGPLPGAAPVEGIWYEDSTSTLQLAAYESMQAPDLDPGVGIFQIGFPAFNAQNQVVFKSALAGPGVDVFVNDQAIWATDLSGDLQLVARTGDLFDVNDDPNVEDFRTISVIGALESSAGTGGRATGFTDTGQLTMMLGFSDFTSGIFTFDLGGAPLSADFDFDGDVDGRDFLIWQRGGSPNGLNSGDLALWQAQYSTPLTANATVVPEPSGLILIILGGVVCCRQR